MSDPKPPKTYQEFVTRFPKLGQAWQMIADAGDVGPLDDKSKRLIKLAIAIGAMREGAVALSASTLGMPSTVAVYTWVQDILTKK